MNRQLFLDTETTGLSPQQGHKIIEIGVVEVVDRELTGKHYHQYIQPERAIDREAYEVHGISEEFLADKPIFAQVADDFMAFIGDGSEVIIHNAPFDVGFINHELKLMGDARLLEGHADIKDSLAMARAMYPGQKNNLDALCRRLGIDNAHRTLHGALLDSEILADVYLRMTGGQSDIELNANTHGSTNHNGGDLASLLQQSQAKLVNVPVSEEQQLQHNTYSEKVAAQSGVNLWKDSQ